MRLAILLSLFAFPVMAQEAVYMPQERDDLEIRASSEGHFAEIAYVNEVSQISKRAVRPDVGRRGNRR
jgi:hypothetical protein